MLQEHVAPAAFHNSKQCVDPPRCHPHTREAVLEDLFNWAVGNVTREAWIRWLNGPAGAGKSAICQSIAEMCIHQDTRVGTSPPHHDMTDINILPEFGPLEEELQERGDCRNIVFPKWEPICLNCGLKMLLLVASRICQKASNYFEFLMSFITCLFPNGKTS